MTRRVFVHVGPHKTGSTFLQTVLRRNKETLAAEGVLFPGHRYGVQRNAVWQVLHHTSTGAPGALLREWEALATEIRDWEGATAIISQEGLAGADRQAIARIVESLSPAEVHVVYAARDLTKVIPGGWHTRMRNGHTESWSRYLAAVRSGDARMWQGADPRAALTRWGEFVPRDRVHVITVPPAGTPNDVLWQRFSGVVGLDAASYSLELPRLNESLGSTETEVLRRINMRVAGKLSRESYARLVRPTVTSGVLARRATQHPLVLPPEEHEWVRDRVDESIRFLRHGGYPITGDLDDLIPRPPSPTATSPENVDLDDALDAAVDVIAALLHELDRRASRKRRVRRPRAEPAARGVAKHAGALLEAGRRGLTRAHRR